MKRMRGKFDKICKGEVGVVYSIMRKMLSIVVVVYLDVDDVGSVIIYIVDIKSYVCKGNCMQVLFFGFDSKVLIVQKSGVVVVEILRCQSILVQSMVFILVLFCGLKKDKCFYSGFIVFVLVV